MSSSSSSWWWSGRHHELILIKKCKVNIVVWLRWDWHSQTFLFFDELLSKWSFACCKVMNLFGRGQVANWVTRRSRGVAYFPIRFGSSIWTTSQNYRFQMVKILSISFEREQVFRLYDEWLYPDRYVPISSSSIFTSWLPSTSAKPPVHLDAALRGQMAKIVSFSLSIRCNYYVWVFMKVKANLNFVNLVKREREIILPFF